MLIKPHKLALAGLLTALGSSNAMAQWQTVEAPLSLDKGRQTYDRVNGLFNVNVTVTNESDAALTGPMRLVVNNASHTLASPSGTSDQGAPYVMLEQDSLGAGESVTVQLKFDYARSRVNFDVSLEHESDESDWVMVWQDEFEGDSIDPDKWGFEENCWGGGNNEQQCYTNRPDNAYVENGVLTILAKKETFTGPDNPNGDTSSLNTLPYTSARLRTMNKGDWTYGRFEIRAKLPQGQGTWPAIWMLPTDYVYGGWAASGEIDIMEAVNLGTPSDEAGAQPGELERRTHGTLHFGRAWPGNVSSGAPYKLPNGESPADGFHEYALEWEQDEMRWYVDGVHFATQTSDGWYSQYKNENGEWVNGEGSAPFNERFHLLLNVAVGGNWAGNTNNGGIDESAFPQTMEVDYVRVYECSVNPATGEGCATIGDNATQVPGHQPPEIIDPVENLGAGPVFNMYINGLLEGMAFDSYNPEGTLSYSFNEEADRGETLVVTQTGSVGNMYVHTDPAIDLTHFAEYGQIAFDLKVIDNSNESDVVVKVDSGWPAVSDMQLELPPQNEWQEMRVSVAELLANGNSIQPGSFANPASVINPFVIEANGPIQVALDNIRYEYSLQGHDEAVIFDDRDHAPFSMGKYVANGTVDIEQVVSADSDHGEVKQITFNTNESVVYFQTQLTADAVPLQLDVSHFDFVEFDLMVLEDPRSERNFNMKMDCGHPCSSGDYPIDAPEIGVWTSYKIPLADLVSHTGGLDLSTVDTPLVIFPAWGNQQGVVMQIDNVRLTSDGDDGNNAPTKVVVDSELTVFDDTFAAGWSMWDCCANATLSLVEDSDRGTVANVDFFGPAPTVSGLSAALQHDVTGISGGTLEFDLKLVNPPSDPSTLILLKVEGSDSSFAQFELAQSNEGQAPVVGQWQHYSYNLSELEANGLNLSRMKLILIFPEWDKATGTVYQLDNVQLLP